MELCGKPPADDRALGSVDAFASTTSRMFGLTWTHESAVNSQRFSVVWSGASRGEKSLRFRDADLSGP